MSEWTKENEHDIEIYDEGYDDGYDAGRKDAIEELRRYFSLSCIYGVTLSWHGASDERAFDRILEEIEEEKRREEEDGTDDQEDRI